MSDWLNLHQGLIGLAGVVISILGFLITNHRIQVVNKNSQKAGDNSEQYMANDGSDLKVKK